MRFMSMSTSYSKMGRFSRLDRKWANSRQTARPSWLDPQARLFNRRTRLLRRDRRKPRIRSEKRPSLHRSDPFAGKSRKPQCRPTKTISGIQRKAEDEDRAAAQRCRRAFAPNDIRSLKASRQAKACPMKSIRRIDACPKGEAHRNPSDPRCHPACPPTPNLSRKSAFCALKSLGPSLTMSA